MEYELKDIPGLIQEHEKIAVLTDKENNPMAIAGWILTSSGHPNIRTSRLVFHVCEKLGYPDERVVTGTAQEIAGMSFSDPNVVIIIRREQ